jgi:serine/threonine-protein kinase
MPKTGDLIAAKYRIEQLIGVGGMGAVFSATHQYTGKRVALKWMLPELAHDEDAVQRFMREARAAGRISHPNVVDVYDVGQHADSYFLVMEYLHGEPLTSALARRDLTPTEVLTLLLPAMRGVAAAHRQGVVHRDLKPDNIFLAYEQDGVRREAKVLDFGISKLSADDQPSMHLTRTGAVIGTPYYMSPEQIRGTGEIDHRVDIYAIGVILYESLSGQVPFMAETYGALVLEIATGTPQSLTELVPNLPVELSRIVLRAMARNVADRYPTMEDLIAALEMFTRPSHGPGAWRSSQRIYSGSGERPMFDETHAAPTPAPQRISLPLEPPAYSPTPSPVGDTRPSRATTPFAAEATRSRSPATSQIYGVASLLAIAAAIVAAALYFTRDPATDPAVAAPVVAPVVAPQVRVTETKNAASSGELQVEDIPRGVSAGAVPSAGGGALDPKALGSDNVPSVDVVAPVMPQRSRRESGHRSAAQARKSAAADSGSKERERERDNDNDKDPDRRVEPRQSPNVADSPEPSPAAPPRESRQSQQQRARSGTLNVNEF